MLFNDHFIPFQVSLILSAIFSTTHGFLFFSKNSLAPFFESLPGFRAKPKVHKSKSHSTPGKFTNDPSSSSVQYSSKHHENSNKPINYGGWTPMKVDAQYKAVIKNFQLPSSNGNALHPSKSAPNYSKPGPVLISYSAPSLSSTYSAPQPSLSFPIDNSYSPPKSTPSSLYSAPASTISGSYVPVYQAPSVSTASVSTSYSASKDTYNAPKPVNNILEESYGAPKPGYNPPKDTYEVPKPAYSASENTYETPKPKETYGAPKPSYNAPEETYGEPKPAYSAPEETYEAPKPSYNTPEETYGAPKPSYEDPQGNARDLKVDFYSTQSQSFEAPTTSSNNYNYPIHESRYETSSPPYQGSSISIETSTPIPVYISSSKPIYFPKSESNDLSSYGKKTNDEPDLDTLYYKFSTDSENTPKESNQRPKIKNIYGNLRNPSFRPAYTGSGGSSSATFSIHVNGQEHGFSHNFDH
ncbi:unnamed protein product [Lepeophtheirus salmonis]|uniref:(salmon louse) hypothetical protein n=1 Tax=Lepeophtheirus salmonis TaxID=72036 RepID=A0A7R8HD99_LEPSM|nr:unnamed protein product [Lepeophtheirus salmonis]CAF3005616.1 unnamed protein product [Lepeophtheirus salmonis]